jgi:hypothetical protein
LNGRTFRAVEQSELNSSLIGDASHQTIESIDLPNEMTFAEAADCRIARHFADGGELVRDEPGSRAHASGCSGSLGARVPASYDDDIIGLFSHFTFFLLGAPDPHFEGLDSIRAGKSS